MGGPPHHEEPPSIRFVLYLGKGGVGKTTIAAATALRCAELGYRTLVVSTDIAHSLADVLDHPLAAEPTPLAERLWGQEINVLSELRTHWHHLQDYFSFMLRQRGVNHVIAEELAIIPGMEEIVSLLHIHRQGRERNFQAVIIDAAPTGESVRLLSLPESFQWYAGRLGQWGAPMWKLARTFGLAPSQDVFDALAKLEDEVTELRGILADPKISSYRVVLNPEKMVIKETQRAVTYLSLFGYSVDAGVINRVLRPEPSPDPYFRRLQEGQRHYLEMIHETFAPLPLFEVPWYGDEVVGEPALRRLAGDLWGNRNPMEVLSTGPGQRVEDRGRECVLSLPLPHIEIDKVEMTKRGDELFITVGNFKRQFVLPHALAIRQATTARLTDRGVLEVHFAEAATN